MHRSRSLIHWWLLSLIGLGLTACTPDMKKSADGAGDGNVATSSRNTSFNVQRVRPNASLDGISDTLTWKIPTSFRLGIQACLQDRASNKEIRNQDFTVVVPETHRTFNVTTTNQGCFTWQEEKIPFNLYASRSGWLTLNRDIVGRGVNQGKQRIQILVNPWKLVNNKRDDLHAAIWPQDGDGGVMPNVDQVFPADQSARALVGESQTQQQAADAPRLLITDVDLTALPKAEGSNYTTYTFQVAMKPRIKALNSIGIPSYESAYDGDFNVWLHVVQNDMGPQLSQKALLLHGEPYAVGHVVDGVLRAEIQVRMPLKANQGNLQLLLKVAPRAISVMGAIQPFQGVFNFGEGTVVKNGKASIAPACLLDPADCNFDKMVEQARSALPDLEAAGYVRPNSRYIFNNLKLRFVTVEPGETATQRTVAYTASTCIITDTGSPLRDTPMTIRYLKSNNGSKDPEQDQHEEVEPDVINTKTDQSGCLNWDGKAFHKYYQPERYFERLVSIEKPSGFKQEFKFYINPWDTNINFGFDSREFGPKLTASMRIRPKIRSRFFLGDFSYHTVRFLYNIDNYMELEVKKWVLMDLVPQVLRYSGIKDARKMTEHLRDGIYLMKVAIQKDYLDPRNNYGWLLQDNKLLQPKKESFGKETLAVDQYVTTNMALVRVVDGMIIYPIELTMRDLRLMRVRSNFMVELQTVDERLIQAYHRFNDHAIKAEDLERKLEEFKRQVANSPEGLPPAKNGPEPLEPTLAAPAESRAALAEHKDEKYDLALGDLKTRVDRVQQIVSDSLVWLKKKLEDPKSTDLSFYLNSAEEDMGLRQRVLKDNFITQDFTLNEDLLADLKKVLRTNDFSLVTLPKKKDVDLNIFVEPDSGLQKRSFVGPVIFLSNAYKDSVRATDNLDEAGCTDPDKPKNAFENAEDELYVRGVEVEAAKAGAQKLEGKRQNNAYTYSKYFGALRHLCYKNVDDLIDWEKDFARLKADQVATASLKGNFSRAFGLDYVSLENEPLRRVREDCAGDVSQCMVDDAESPLKTEAVSELLNGHNFTTRFANTFNTESLTKLAESLPFFTGKTHWEPSELRELFLGRQTPNGDYAESADARVGLCALLANKFALELDQTGLGHTADFNVRRKTIAACVAQGGLIHDFKDHVKRTDRYMLMGGLNLNINVGTSFSMSWSGSWSAGVDLGDFIGVAAGLPGSLTKFAGALRPALGIKSAESGILGAVNKQVDAGAAKLNAASAAASSGMAVVQSVAKPFSAKYGVGMSNSEGTSVSESTYLVSQVAKFNVDLLAYERCAVVRLSDQAIHELDGTLGDNTFSRATYKRSVNFDDPRVQALARHGLLVCEGEKTAEANPKKTVEEMYFYFTQHFTEGDMLDQAELYNHPWLLALRGMRDFTAFIAKVRAQDQVGFLNFARGLLNMDKPRANAWALEHMRNQFANTLPSFPGFYSKPDEDISAFLLQQSRDNALNRDPNREVLRTNLGEDAKPEAKPGRASAPQ